MDINKLMSLVRVEVLISKYYNQMCKKEIMKQYGSDFTSLIGLLKNAIKEQNKIIDTFNIIELVGTDSKTIKQSLSYFNEEINIDDVVARLSILSTSKLVLRGIEGGLNIADKEQMIAKYIVSGEDVNIQLSFIDEYLSNIDDLSLRKELCEYKYFLIYAMGMGIEEELINRCYHTEKSIYLTAYLEAKGKNIPVSYIATIKKELAHKKLDSNLSIAYRLVLRENPKDIINKLFYGQKLLKYSIGLRTDLLALDDKDFIDVLNKLGVKKDNPWYKVFLSDKERHKTITIGYDNLR